MESIHPRSSSISSTQACSPSNTTSLKNAAAMHMRPFPMFDSRIYLNTPMQIHVLSHPSTSPGHLASLAALYIHRGTCALSSQFVSSPHPHPHSHSVLFRKKTSQQTQHAFLSAFLSAFSPPHPSFKECQRRHPCLSSPDDIASRRNEPEGVSLVCSFARTRLRF
jgi:hypothetical protein